MKGLCAYQPSFTWRCDFVSGYPKRELLSIEAAAGGMQFATARGWEDLAALLTVYESLELPVDRELIGHVSSFRASPRILQTIWSCIANMTRLSH